MGLGRASEATPRSEPAVGGARATSDSAPRSRKICLEEGTRFVDLTGMSGATANESGVALRQSAREGGARVPLDRDSRRECASAFGH